VYEISTSDLTTASKINIIQLSQNTHSNCSLELPADGKVRKISLARVTTVEVVSVYGALFVCILGTLRNES